MTDPAPLPPRLALVAGASGLVGGELLAQLQTSSRYQRIHVLVRRPGARVGSGPKLDVHTVDFTRLPERLPAVDDVYIALGTTIKVAGSAAAFRRVDHDFVVATATAARAAGAQRLAVVSALGADPNSAVFYNRVKGEMQAAVAALGFETVLIAQPSLLLGNRAALGQPARPGERWATLLLGPVQRLIPKAVRPIDAAAVARAMIAATLEGRAGVSILSSATMQPR